MAHFRSGFGFLFLSAGSRLCRSLLNGFGFAGFSFLRLLLRASASGWLSAFDQFPMQRTLVGIDQGDSHLDTVSHAEGSSALPSGHRVSRPVVVEAFAVGQIADMDEAVDRVFLAAAENSEFFDAGDHCPERFFRFRGKKHQQFDSGQFPFCLSGSAFHAGAVGSKFDRFDLAQTDLIRFSFDDFFEEAMNGQVGVSSNRAREVAVVFDGQGEVPVDQPGVLGRFHAAEKCEAESLLERFAPNF